MKFMSLVKAVIAVSLTSLLSAGAYAASIDPATVNLPWKNGPARDSTYVLSANPNKVHVFEAYSIDCGACNSNVPAVKAMAAEYSANTRVQFLDLGLDSDDASYTSWIRRYSPAHPVVKDEGQRVWRALAQQNLIPQVFIVDCNGRMVDYNIGTWGTNEKAKIRRAITAALAVECQ